MTVLSGSQSTLILVENIELIELTVDVVVVVVETVLVAVDELDVELAVVDHVVSVLWSLVV